MTDFETKRVVNDLSLNFYENQITGLLGYYIFVFQFETSHFI